MALVVFLRGVNVGGHRTFRPTTLAQELKHLGAVNIGAAGTFVIRRAITRSQLRAEVTSRIPFATEMAICAGRDIVRLVSRDPFADEIVRPDTVRFVSVPCRRPRSLPSIPIRFPSNGDALLTIIARDHQFILGIYRRHMRAITHLGNLDRIVGVPLTTRNWNTITAIAAVLGNDAATR